MAKIWTIFNNGGKAKAKTGVVKVNSFNVCPDTIVAAPTPATLTAEQLAKYDYFLVDQTSAATDEFDLPDAAEVGDVITLYAVSAFEVRTETDAAEINGVGSFGFTTVAKSTYTCTKVEPSGSVDEWRVVAVAENGSVTTLTVNVAP